ncbi:MAG: nucleoside deaminase [Gammaproteobacteria bacterium]|nr:nucleoside deaminase [Gammaproteobacteria bacterium]
MMQKHANKDDYHFMQIALNEAKKGLSEGGIPIGSCLVIDGQVVAKGHNQRVQKNNPILHGEMDCLRKAGRLKAQDYQKATLYTTLSPCPMCSGAIRLFKIPRVVMAENKNFVGDEELLIKEGIVLVNLDLDEAINMMKKFIDQNPELWNEDIAV